MRFICGQISLTPHIESSLRQLLMGVFPYYLLLFELWGHISPIHFHVNPHIFLFSLFLCRFDEPVVLFTVDLIKMVFVHFQFYLMSAAGYFSRDCNKPINICTVFLFFEFVRKVRYRHLAFGCQS